MDIVENGCMNPWDHYYTETKDKFEKITEFLSSKDIWLKHITSFTYYTGPVCLSRACHIERLITIQIPDFSVVKAGVPEFSLINDNKLNIPGSRLKD